MMRVRKTDGPDAGSTMTVFGAGIFELPFLTLRGRMIVTSSIVSLVRLVQCNIGSTAEIRTISSSCEVRFSVAATVSGLLSGPGVYRFNAGTSVMYAPLRVEGNAVLAGTVAGSGGLSFGNATITGTTSLGSNAIST